MKSLYEIIIIVPDNTAEDQIVVCIISRFSICHLTLE